RRGAWTGRTGWSWRSWCGSAPKKGAGNSWWSSRRCGCRGRPDHRSTRSPCSEKPRKERRFPMAGRQVTVFALVKAKSGMEETVKKELSALVAPTLKEEGCINYDLHQSLDHAGHFRFY